ncbi:MAG TPA: hypothetical protein VGE55_14005 [Limnobacter sp.]
MVSAQHLARSAHENLDQIFKALFKWAMAMTEKPLTTTREALMAELLIDVDRLFEKVSDLDRPVG